MDRFAWTDGILSPDEQLIVQQSGVRLYDGETKSAFDYGKLQLTTHRLIWRHPKDQKCIISLHLSLVVLAEEQSSGFYKGPKIVVHLSTPEQYKPPGPVTSSPNHFIKLSFKEGGEPTFYPNIQDALQRKQWQVVPKAVSASASGKQWRSGIGGIERNIQKKAMETDKNITEAFEDLNKLMDQAKQMVTLSKNISTKIREKQGDITEDETVRFKSYLLSLGISDPVTRDTHGSGQQYYKELAKQVATFIQEPLKECGGTMTLTDAYCRVNRARGLELLSPEDLVNACQMLEIMQLPVRLQVFESGVMVLILATHCEEQAIIKTTQVVEEAGSLTADELARLIGLSVVLSKERLLSAENKGNLCRDETVEGLRFYPNKFLIQT